MIRNIVAPSIIALSLLSFPSFAAEDVLARYTFELARNNTVFEKVDFWAGSERTQITKLEHREIISDIDVSSGVVTPVRGELKEGFELRFSPASLGTEIAEFELAYFGKPSLTAKNVEGIKIDLVDQEKYDFEGIVDFSSDKRICQSYDTPASNLQFCMTRHTL